MPRWSFRSTLFLVVCFLVQLPCIGVFASKPVYRAALPHVPGLMYRNPDGSPGGFAAELLVNIARDENLTLEWIDGSWPELFEKTKRGEIDVLLNTQVTAERKKVFDFLEQPLQVMWGELYVTEDTGFKSIQQLENKRIAVTRGDNNAVGFEEYIASFQLPWRKVEFDSHEQAIEALKSRSVYAMAGPTPASLGDAFNGLKRSGLVFNPSPLSIAFPRGKNPELREAIDRRIALYRASPNSILFALMREYHIGTFVEPRNHVPHWVGPVILALIVLGTVAILFVVLLRNQVRRRTEELLSSNKKLWQAAEIAKLGHWDLDHSRNTVHLSAHLMSMLELPRGYPQFITLDELRTFIHGEDLASSDDEFQRSLRTRSNYNFTHRLITKTGETKWVLATGFHEFVADVPQTTFGIVLDITERVLATEELKRTTEQLHHAERMESIGQLAGGIAHDFNNMLSGIIGYAELLEDEQDVKGIQKHAANIIEAAEKAAGLTSQLLAFARKEQLIMKAVSLHGATATAITLLKRTIDKKIAIQTRFDAPNDVVRGDSASLANAILNLAINSRDAMPEGGTLSIATDVVAYEGEAQAGNSVHLAPGQYIQLTVADTGTGIAKENLKRIFEPFFTTKPSGKGTGLGLSAVYGTIKSHGGDIRVHSEEGKGTSVTVYLPVLTQAIEEAVEVHHVPEVTQYRLLLVEDERLLRQMSRQMLTSAGHSVAVAEDGEKGLETFTSCHSELDGVILDLQMPKMNGRELLAQIRRIVPQMPVLVVSGYSDDNREAPIPVDDVTAFLQKPYRKSALLAAIDNLLQQAMQRRR